MSTTASAHILRMHLESARSKNKVLLAHNQELIVRLQESTKALVQAGELIRQMSAAAKSDAAPDAVTTSEAAPETAPPAQENA
jgi:peptidoglycan hydrolase CwlO-like protein